MIRLLLSVALAIALGLPSPLVAQSGDPSFLTLERIFASGEFRSDFFGPARWLADGSGYTTLEPSIRVQAGRDIVRYDPASGGREVLVPAERLIPQGQVSPLYIDDYEWSAPTVARRRGSRRKATRVTTTSRAWSGRRTRMNW